MQVRWLPAVLLLGLIPLAASAAAIPNQCTPLGALCVGEREFVWHSDDQCTGPNSYYSRFDGFTLSLFVASTGWGTESECRNQDQYDAHYHKRGFRGNTGVFLVGGLEFTWQESEDHGGPPTCDMWITGSAGTRSFGCPLGAPYSGPVTP